LMARVIRAVYSSVVLWV